MSIKRYTSSKDNTIATAFRENLSARSTQANMGASDILELFSIYAQANTSSVEKTRILMQFPIDKVASSRTSSEIPASGSVEFKLKLSNTPHGQTTPEDFKITVHPLLRAWTEGDGLDMESYLDLEASNWASASSGVPWHTTGSDYAQKDSIPISTIPFYYEQSLELGTENINLDVTPWVEEWIKHENGATTAATASLRFIGNPSENQYISIRSHEGQNITYRFITSSTYSVGNTVYLQLSGAAAGTVGALHNRLATDFNSKITTTLNSVTLSLAQSAGGLLGNTLISSDIAAGTVSASNHSHFGGGTAMPNYGVVMRLSGSFEDGTNKQSYYTKKFYSRSSHEFFLKPQIEAQWDDSTKDDRNNVAKSSPLGGASENINSIFLYNRRGTSLMDIPAPSTYILAQLMTSSTGGTAETLVQTGGVAAGALTYITASKVSTGVYKADFEYSGTKAKLYDMWYKSSGTNASLTALGVTGSFTVHTQTSDTSYKIPDHTITITNLKDSYLPTEKVTLRLYTRDKNWSPNVYTVSNTDAPVNNVENMFYKVIRVSDNYQVIGYSTGSVPSYSSLSYDSKGSFFDLDMSLLEANNAYEISFVSKEGSNYIEQQEKFRFRVDP